MDEQLNTNELGFALGIKKQVYNNELRKRREALGMSQEQFAKAVGIPNLCVQNFEKFTKYPSVRKHTGKHAKNFYEKAGQKIADFLKVDFYVLFPKWLSAFELKSPTVKTEQVITERILGNKDVLLLTSEIEVDEKIDQDLLKKEFSSVLKTLSPREQKVLEVRFGLNGNDSHTLDETAELIPKINEATGSVTRERIRQVENKALRKLRHPSRSKKLRPFIEDTTDKVLLICLKHKWNVTGLRIGLYNPKTIYTCKELIPKKDRIYIYGQGYEKLTKDDYTMCGRILERIRP